MPSIYDLFGEYFNNIVLLSAHKCDGVIYRLHFLNFLCFLFFFKGPQTGCMQDKIKNLNIERSMYKLVKIENISDENSAKTGNFKPTCHSCSGD